ncbi:MAG: hypothetical protein LC793_10340, partial [Thermomicrobia bacterium]|nr:hypothetical protein [Thermomicrobia bacterium]
GLSNVTGIPGVYGVASSGSTHGVIGSGANGGAGVFGINSNAVGIGVQGFNDHGPAVQGNTSEGMGVKGIAGTTGYGVAGTSASGIGVYGTTGGTGLVAGLYGASSTAYGIIGSTTASGYSGLTAITGTPGVAALAATSTVSSAFAAYFSGFTYVQGNFAVTGNKSAAVMHPDGTYRLLYCVESPEAWFEDFGEATLVGGKAEVKLDPDFAALVLTTDYHVFPVSHDAASKGLAVIARRADGFTVAEHSDGTSAGTFSWRVVAKRKDNPGKRLEKFVPIKVNVPDPAKLPKMPQAGAKP